MDSYHSNTEISNRNMVTRSQKPCRAVSIQTKEKKSLESKIKLSGEIIDGGVVLTLPLRTISEANNFEHWTKSHKRHKIQQKTVALALNPIKCEVRLPCHIKLVRYAQKKLDKHDNLPMSFKYIVDACCAIITGEKRAGKADDNEQISISYDQVQSKEYYVKIYLQNL